jgi:hypothetical protein
LWKKRRKEMPYVRPNFKTKKALKTAVLEGKPVTVWQMNNLFNRVFEPGEKNIVIEMPWYPEPHRAYAQVDLDEEGFVCKVK